MHTILSIRSLDENDPLPVPLKKVEKPAPEVKRPAPQPTNNPDVLRDAEGKLYTDISKNKGVAFRHSELKNLPGRVESQLEEYSRKLAQVDLAELEQRITADLSVGVGDRVEIPNIGFGRLVHVVQDSAYVKLDSGGGFYCRAGDVKRAPAADETAGFGLAPLKAESEFEYGDSVKVVAGVFRGRVGAVVGWATNGKGEALIRIENDGKIFSTLPRRVRHA